MPLCHAALPVAQCGGVGVSIARHAFHVAFKYMYTCMIVCTAGAALCCVHTVVDYDLIISDVVLRKAAARALMCSVDTTVLR